MEKKDLTSGLDVSHDSNGDEKKAIDAGQPDVATGGAGRRKSNALNIIENPLMVSTIHCSITPTLGPF